MKRGITLALFSSLLLFGSQSFAHAQKFPSFSECLARLNQQLHVIKESASPAERKQGQQLKKKCMIQLVARTAATIGCVAIVRSALHNYPEWKGIITGLTSPIIMLQCAIGGIALYLPAEFYSYYKKQNPNWKV